MILRLFRKAQDGMAAVEFALLLPVMITLFFGTVEISMALLCRADVSIMVSTASDLVAQESTVQTSDISNVYAAATTILYPYYNPSSSACSQTPAPPQCTPPTIRITSINYNSATGSTTSGKVAWTCTQAGSGTLTPATRSPADIVTLPQAIMPANGSVIMAEVAYKYSSPTMQMITGPLNMTNVWYTKPRRVMQISGPSACP
ncbi:MAG TPA: TadE/TadG family type IV pilus assembly protein [Rhizomicrobium sp.]|nr:TadE/TadG family type IV pilus assembly protein [Rhizomicrobium sp.]